MTHRALQIALAAFLVLAVPFCVAAVQYGTVEDGIEITVTEKQIKTKGGESHYLIFTEGEVFTLEDNLFHGNFRSSDEFSKLKEGETYRVKVNGWRLGLTSSYRNILSVEPIE